MNNKICRERFNIPKININFDNNYKTIQCTVLKQQNEIYFSKTLGNSTIIKKTEK